MTKSIRYGEAKRIIIRTEKDRETVVAVAESCHEMARMLGITPQAVSHGIHRKSRKWHVVEVNEDDDG